MGTLHEGPRKVRASQAPFSQVKPWPPSLQKQRIAAHVMGTRSGSLIHTVASPGPSLDRMGTAEEHRGSEAPLEGRTPTRGTANKSHFGSFALNPSRSSTEAQMGFGFPIGFQGGP